MAAIVEAPNLRWLVSSTTTSCFFSSQTSSRQLLFALPSGLLTAEHNNLVTQDLPLLRHHLLSHHLVDQLLLHLGDEPHALSSPAAEERQVRVTTINSNDAARR